MGQVFNLLSLDEPKRSSRFALTLDEPNNQLPVTNHYGDAAPSPHLPMRSTNHIRPTLWTLLALAISVSFASAQLPTADLTRIYPPGAAAGTDALAATLTGTDLDGASQLLFTHPGITATQVTLPADGIYPAARPKANSFTVKVAANVPPGIYEVRAAGGRFGISTPRAFAISPAGTGEIATPSTAITSEAALAITPGQVITSAVPANNQHWFRLTAKKGQHLSIRCDAQRIDSKLDGALILHDANGKEIDRNNDFNGRDPVIDLQAPADGDYLVALHDFLYLGGTTHFYRLSVVEGPRIDGVFPPVVSTVKPTPVTPFGFGLGEKPAALNLPPLKDSPEFSPINAMHHSTRITHFKAKNSSRPVLAVTDHPVIIEDEESTNDSGQKISLPCTIGARFDRTDDSDAFRFTAKNGTTYEVEIVGARLESDIDPYVVIEKITVDDKGVETFTVARELDDLSFGPATDATFRLTSRDPASTFAATHDGDYRVTVINQFGSGSPGTDHVYAVHIREQSPDFSLLATAQRPHLEANQVFAAAPLLRKGESFPLRVVISRRGGFSEPVTVTASGLPAGVTAPPVTIAPQADSTVLILRAAADAAPAIANITLSGSAKVGDKNISRPVSIAAPVWSVTNIGTERLRTRSWTQLPLAVSDAESAPVQVVATEPGGKPFSVTIGEKLEIPVKLEAKGEIKGNLAVQPFGLHANIKPVAAQIADKANEGKVVIDFNPSANHKPVPGTFHFVIKGSGILAKYKTDPPALEAATKEQARIIELQKKLTADAAKAKTDLAAAKAAFDKATAAANAAKPEAKAAADTALAAAKGTFDTATKSNTDLAAKVKAAATAKTAADAVVKTATARSKERDVKFTAYSLPIRVEVKPKPEPAKK